MNNKERKQQLFTRSLLAVYLCILTWIILFKMQFSFQELDRYHGINLIPFHESVIVNNRIQFSEIYNNILIFVPFGVYISMLKSNWTFLKKVVMIAGVSLFYEIIQFLLTIGASDITDLIGNTLGGIIGITIYCILCRVFKINYKRNKIMNSIALVATICIVLLLILLVIANT
ncbi:MAG: VanZ family protein [Lachnotalea sp.]